MIKAILIDCGGVLLPLPTPLVCNELAVRYDKDGIRLDQIMRKILDESFDLGKINEEEFVDSFIMESDLMQAEPEEIKKLWRFFLAVDPEMITWIKEKRKKYPVYLSSNISKEYAEFLTKKYDFTKLFDKLFMSWQMGKRKPDTAFFEIIMKTLAEKNILPAEMMFIDDRIENIETARKEGIQTIHFQNKKQFMQDFEKIEKELGGII